MWLSSEFGIKPRFKCDSTLLCQAFTLAQIVCYSLTKYR